MTSANPISSDVPAGEPAIGAATSAAPMPPAPTPSPPNARASAVHRIANRSLVIGFLTALVLPMIGTWRHWDPAYQFNENRTLAALPGVPRSTKDFIEWGDNFDHFYRDHFGFRQALIRGLMLARYYGPGVDNAPTVLVAKDGWLFFRYGDDPDYLAYRGLSPMTSQRLDAWEALFEKRQAWLAQQGIPYFVVILPDKQTIYPELVPKGWQKVIDRSHLDQLEDHLRETHSPVKLLDVRQELFAAKPTGLLYKKTDTHWNDHGAYIAYVAIMNQIAREVPGKVARPLPPSALRERDHWDWGGDLARGLDLPDRFEEFNRDLIPIDSPPMPEGFTNLKSTTIVDVDDPSLPRIVMFRDSYANSMMPMFRLNFSHAVFKFDDWIDAGIVRQAKPDIVISEFVERKLDSDLPADSAEITAPGR
jgi:hypothetical protein